MALQNFTRPNLPYANKPLANDKRFEVLTQSLKAPPTDVMIDSEFNAVIDYLNILDGVIQGISDGILPGANNPANANFLPTTDGNNNISWVQITDTNCQVGSINANKLIDLSVTAQQIQDGGIPGTKIAPLTIEANNIANGAVGVNQINANAGILGTQIANQTLTAANLTANAGILGSQLSINAGIVGNQLSSQAGILGTQLANNADILGTQLAANAGILGSQLAANAGIVGTQLVNGTITSTQIDPAYKPAAVKADQTTGTSTTVYVNPAVQQFHPSANKAMVNFYWDGTNVVITSSYNIAGVVRNGVGSYTINFNTPFSSSNYCYSYLCKLDTNRSQTAIFVTMSSAAGGGTDPTPNSCTIGTGYFNNGLLTDRDNAAGVSLIFAGTQ